MLLKAWAPDEKNSIQLKEADVNTLNIYFEVSGVGDTAIRQLEKYRVKPVVINFQFSIKPF